MARAPYIGMFPSESDGDSNTTPLEGAFPTPADVKMFAGEGASEADLKRGYLEPDITQAPEYNLSNYKDRMSVPNGTDFEKDWNFREKDRVSDGFLTRSRFSDER